MDRMDIYIYIYRFISVTFEGYKYENFVNCACLLYLQTLLAVSGRCLPEHVMSKQTAVILVVSGWGYSILLALLLAFIPTGNDPITKCSFVDLFPQVPRMLFAATIIGIGVVIVTIQLVTYWKLWKQIHMAIGQVSAMVTMVTRQGTNCIRRQW